MRAAVIVSQSAANSNSASMRWPASTCGSHSRASSHICSYGTPSTGYQAGVSSSDGASSP